MEGSLAHSDTGGHESVIHAGGVQWMTAGSGLIHAELSPAAFKRAGGEMEILQLWLNLPARLKMSAAALHRAAAAGHPLSPARTRRHSQLVAGTFGDVTGPVASLTDTFMSSVELSPGAEVDVPAPAGRTVFLYVVRGEASVDGAPALSWHLAELGGGDIVRLASRDGALLLFGHSEPLNEPVVAHGPFVMNTREEIVQAVRDYQSGLFGNPAALVRKKGGAPAEAPPSF